MMTADLGGVQQQIEQALQRNVAGAAAADVEEMLAILTASTRSYERKLAKSGGQMDMADFISQLGTRYVADEGLLDASQWALVAEAVQSSEAPAASPLAVLREVDERVNAGIAGLAISGDDKEEAVAIVTTTCRSMARKIKGGQLSGDIKGQVEAMLYARLVEEETLLSHSDWAALAAASAAFTPAPAAAADASSFGNANAPAPRRAVVPELLEELVKLFPNKARRDLQVAAASAAGPLLEDAVFQVLSLEGPAAADLDMDSPQVDSAIDAIQSGYNANKAKAYPGAQQRVQDVAVTGTAQRLETQFVTTGACGFGHCFDIKTADKAVTVTSLYSASSPGLNWGQGMAIKAKIYATKQQRRSRGVELDPTAWRLVGQNDKIELPMVSWADGENAVYGELPLGEPVTIPANSVQGFMVHTNDLYGLVQSVGVGGGGEMETWGAGGADEVQLPFVAGDVVDADSAITLVAGLAIGGNVFQDLEGLAMPTAGGFVGYIDYIVEN